MKKIFAITGMILIAAIAVLTLRQAYSEFASSQPYPRGFCTIRICADKVCFCETRTIPSRVIAGMACQDNVWQNSIVYYEREELWPLASY